MRTLRGPLALTVGLLFTIGGGDRPVPAQEPPAAVQIVSLQANGLVYDQERHLLYASAGMYSPLKNKICAIEPKTGKIAWWVDVGTEPGPLALSDKSEKLWIGLKGESGIQAVDLARRKAGPVLPLGRGSLSPHFAEALLVVPGTTDSVVVALRNNYFSPLYEGVGVYDNGTPRAKGIPKEHTSSRLVLGERPNLLYGCNSGSDPSVLFAMTVEKDGITQSKLSLKIQGFSNDIAFGGGRVFASSGAVVDGQTGELVGTLPAKGLITGNAARKRVYYLIDDRTLKAYDAATLAEMAAYTVGNINTGHGSRGLVRMGDDGLAFLTTGQVVLVPLSLLQEKRE